MAVKMNSVMRIGSENGEEECVKERIMSVAMKVREIKVRKQYR